MVCTIYHSFECQRFFKKLLKRTIERNRYLDFLKSFIITDVQFKLRDLTFTMLDIFCFENSVAPH